MRFVDSAEQNVYSGDHPVEYIIMLKMRAWHTGVVTEHLQNTRPWKPSAR